MSEFEENSIKVQKCSKWKASLQFIWIAKIKNRDIFTSIPIVIWNQNTVILNCLKKETHTIMMEENSYTKGKGKGKKRNRQS